MGATEPAPRRVPDASSGRPSAPTILVVDDDEYVRTALVAALRGVRARTLVAESAAEGLALALEHRPQLAIVDVGLPDADGYELTRRIRAREELRGLAVLILTGHVPDESAARAAGADAIIGKPFRLNEFLQSVRLHLGRDTAE